jgi:hypothetical protein
VLVMRCTNWLTHRAHGHCAHVHARRLEDEAAKAPQGPEESAASSSDNGGSGGGSCGVDRRERGLVQGGVHSCSSAVGKQLGSSWAVGQLGSSAHNGSGSHTGYMVHAASAHCCETAAQLLPKQTSAQLLPSFFPTAVGQLGSSVVAHRLVANCSSHVLPIVRI